MPDGRHEARVGSGTADQRLHRCTRTTAFHDHGIVAVGGTPYWPWAHGLLLAEFWHAAICASIPRPTASAGDGLQATGPRRWREDGPARISTRRAGAIAVAFALGPH